MLAGVELRLELRSDLPRHEDRQRHRGDQCHGARAHHGRLGEGHRRLLYRQGDRRRAPGAVPHGRALGGCLRIGAPAPQLQVLAAPERAGELERHRWQVPDRYGRRGALRDRAVPQGHAHPQHGWIWRAPVYSLVDGGSALEARLPARLSRGGRRRRVWHAVARVRRTGLHGERGVWPPDEGGHP